jgi:DNA-binding MarR family transcriptional regulator
MELSLFSDADFRLWGAITRVRDSVVKVRERELATLGVTSIETFALFLLFDANQPLMPIQLSREMHRNHNTVSALLIRMEHKGMVKRFKNRNNNNIWKVSLTEYGTHICRQAMKIDSIHYVMGSFTDEEKQNLESHLRQIENRAEQLMASSTRD